MIFSKKLKFFSSSLSLGNIFCREERQTSPHKVYVAHTSSPHHPFTLFSPLSSSSPFSSLSHVRHVHT